MISSFSKRLLTNMATQFIKHKKFAIDGQPFTVLVEGNIGSGKTTYLNHFEKFDEVFLQAEPVEKWRNVGGVNILELLYKEPERWALPFQSYVTLTMLQAHTSLTNRSIKIMERSLFSAKYCFVESMLSNGIIDQGMYNILQEWYDYIRENVHIQVDLIVYLRTSPEVAFERVKARARHEEKAVPLEYLKQLHELHENWLIHGNRERPAPVMVLDADLNLNDIGSEYKRSENRILNPIWIDNTNQNVINTSPSKRKQM